MFQNQGKADTEKMDRSFISKSRLFHTNKEEQDGATNRLPGITWLTVQSRKNKKKEIITIDTSKKEYRHRENSFKVKM